MTIDKNTVVSVNYLLTRKDTGETIEQTSKEHPFVFLFGSGGLLEDFEKNLFHKKAGDTFDFFIDNDKAYGPRDEQFLANVPMDAFLDEDGNFDEVAIKVGVTLPMVDNEGHPLHGTVLEITEAHVKMDFNHPLAGHDLHFKGEILDVRAATAEELAHGHVHGAGGHHH
jgi:FKBP-type peptidyl-prolyl cis-trans isomerase SlyD